MIINQPIIPSKQRFAKKPETDHVLDSEAICVFIATGFFMGEDTYWKDQVCLAPAHYHTMDENGYLLKSVPSFKWHYEPRDIDFKSVLQEYEALLTEITKDQVGDSRVILPLSGGLDSRSQALVLKNLKNPVHAFSYSFHNGFREDKIAQKIADNCGFEFSAFSIKPGYLWPIIDELASINGSYSEFTHPRQMAVLPELKKMDGIFSLGHWGDVLFDRGISEGVKENEVIPYLFKKMVKPKGLELAEKLWKVWGLNGNFKSYLTERIETALEMIKIDNLSARVRAFKTSQWAHRWTTTNLSVFEAAHPITMPYYDNRMCEFICGIPEAFLADRKLQIAHLKQDKGIADITWQTQNPFHLNNYNYNKLPYNVPFRVYDKLKRTTNRMFGKPHILRNWELQFLGEANDRQLKNYLFEDNFNHWIPESLVKKVYDEFRHESPIQSSHAVSMLLTLSLWHKNQKNIQLT